MKKLKLKLFYNRYIFSIYKNLIYRSAIGCTIFFVNPSGVYTNKFDSFPTLEYATYNCTWEKHRANALDGKHVNNIFENSVSSFQINALYPLVRLGNYFLFSDIQTITSSQIWKLYPLLRYANYILFSDIHSISSSQTHYILFSDIQTISSSQKYTYPLFR